MMDRWARDKRDQYLDYQYGERHVKKCPVCGKEAVSKYFCESEKKWVYRHPRLYHASTYCKADK